MVRKSLRNSNNYKQCHGGRTSRASISTVALFRVFDAGGKKSFADAKLVATDYLVYHL